MYSSWVRALVCLVFIAGIPGASHAVRGEPTLAAMGAPAGGMVIAQSAAEGSESPQKAGADKGKEDPKSPFAAWFQTLFGGALGLALGFLAKWMLERWNARVAMRREFAKEVTKQISTLAEGHYWALANAAGVLAGELERFLDDRTYHLVISWDSREALRARLDEIANDAAMQCFPHFCRFIWLVDAFQFQRSTTYLLTNYMAGDVCKRLYNMFVESLPAEMDLANIRELTTDVEDQGRKVTRKLRDLPSGTLTDSDVHKQLANEQNAFSAWFKSGVPELSAAAHALRAYNELLTHELALLYRLWFKRRPPDPETYSLEQSFGTWPGVLTRQSVVAIGAAAYQSHLLRPLGAALKVSAPPPERTPPASSAESAQPRAQSKTPSGDEPAAPAPTLAPTLNPGQRGTGEGLLGRKEA